MNTEMSRWAGAARLGTAVVAAGALLALSACGSGESDDGLPAPPPAEEESAPPAADLRNAPVPGTDPADSWDDDADLPEEPGSDAPVAEAIAYDVYWETARYAKDFDPDHEVDCPGFDESQDSEITCEVTYFGQAVPWDVSISGGDYVVTYQYESDQRVVSRAYLEDALRYESQSEDVACPIDEYALVSAEGEFDEGEVVCQSMTEGAAVSWELSLSGYGDATFYEV